MWKAIVEDDDRRKGYETLVGEILHTISSGFHAMEMNKIDVMYGTSGFILFYCYCNKFSETNIHEPAIEELVRKTFSVIDDFPEYDLSLGKGITGVAWHFQHLINNGFFEADFEEIFSEICADLENYSKTELDMGNYDYLLGGLGYMLLILDSNLADKEKYEPYIKVCLEQLNKLSVPVGAGQVTWSLKRKLKNFNELDTIFNLGLSHGVPGIIIILGLIYEKFDAYKENCRLLIESAINWMLSTKTPEQRSDYPDSIINGQSTGNSTLRWCYGDLGIGMSFYLTGLRLANEDWQREGIETISKCARRIKKEIAVIPDSHLCHGVAGVGHIFNRAYQYTQLEEFKEAAIFCFDTVLSRVLYNDDKNVIFLADKGDFGLVPFGGVMEGSTGIALTLLAAISAIEPKWDRLFLLS
jgi:lantibiotic modifying enzyme